MNCPSCQTLMREREKGDVIIDVCPNCRGVWLDAGELEELSERERRYYNDDDDDDDDDDDWHDRRGPADRREPRVQSSSQPQRTRSFLSSMFESFGEGGGD